MKKFLLFAVLGLSAAPGAFAQSDAESRCRAELANRGFGQGVERVTVNGGSVTGNLRSGNELVAFNCLVDNSGNVMEVRVDRSRESVDRSNDVGADYQRGYRDGLRNSPANNYGNSEPYQRGYEAGAQQRWRNRYR